MEKYKTLLINQYKEAKGVFADYDSDLFKKWLNDRKEEGEKYLNWLKELEIINTFSKNVAEIGKGSEDSLTLDYGTTLITPYIDLENSFSKQNKIIPSSLGVFDGIPLYLGYGSFIPVKDVGTFMTQNPYNSFSIMNWHQLYNYGDFDTIVGMYGKIYDEDRTAKIDCLRNMKEKIDGKSEIINMTNGDEYYSVLSTMVKKRW